MKAGILILRFAVAHVRKITVKKLRYRPPYEYRALPDQIEESPAVSN